MCLQHFICQEGFYNTNWHLSRGFVRFLSAYTTQIELEIAQPSSAQPVNIECNLCCSYMIRGSWLFSFTHCNSLIIIIKHIKTGYIINIILRGTETQERHNMMNKFSTITIASCFTTIHSQSHGSGKANGIPPSIICVMIMRFIKLLKKWCGQKWIMQPDVLLHLASQLASLVHSCNGYAYVSSWIVHLDLTLCSSNAL